MDRNRENTACISPHPSLLKENRQSARRSSHNILKQTKKKTLIEWKPIGAKIITAKFNSRFNSRYTKLTIISSYTPIENADKVDKEAFYDNLQEAIQRVPVHDMLLVIGDLDARVGNDNAHRESNMGTQRCGIMKDN